MDSLFIAIPSSEMFFDSYTEVHLYHKILLTVVIYPPYRYLYFKNAQGKIGVKRVGNGR